jgi:predicted ATPase
LLLVSNELIFQRGAPPDAEYTFKHALVQDAAYSTLRRNLRRG